MEVVTLTICNWEKFNPSEETKTPFWFRVNINISSSESLFGLPRATKWTWICLLSEAKRKKSCSIALNLEWAANNWNIKLSDLKQDIELIKEKSLLRVDSESTPSGLRVDSALQTNKQTNKHTSSCDDLHELAVIWNEHCKNLPKVKEMNPKRLNLCKLSFSKNKEPMYWIQLIGALANHGFSNGQNKSGWRANFDYFLRAEVQTKLLEGSFANKKETSFVEKDL